MSFRARLLLGGLLLALAPLTLFGLWAREEVTARLAAQYQARVDALADVIEEDLAREAAALAARLDRLAAAVADDNTLRLAIQDPGAAGEAGRTYMLDYAAGAMPLAGLDMLRIQDASGRVLSSGHFRAEYDAVDPALPAALAGTGDRAALVAAPTASGPMLVLARSLAVTIGPRTLTLVGGTVIDEPFLDQLARGTGLQVELMFPETGNALGDGRIIRSATGATAPDPDALTRRVAIPFAGEGAGDVAYITVRGSTAPLAALRDELDRWLATALVIAGGLALLLALVTSARLSRPLAELARRASRLDLDRLDVSFALRRRDEVGALSRVLDRMTRRLRAGTAKLREAERRATVGEIARQVNHDVRNGLVPIGNVVTHLGQLARESPDRLPAVFLDRQATLESSVAYLHSLAANYARLSPRLERRPCDLNAIAGAVADDAAAGASAGGEADGVESGGGGSRSGPGGRVVARLEPNLPRVHADPVALRRIVENLVVNALDSLDDRPGQVTVSARRAPGSDPPRVLLEVADTGRGMTEEEQARIFQDFYTTKGKGGGLGLSIVRRLVGDLGGGIRVESEPGKGTRFTIELEASP